MTLELSERKDLLKKIVPQGDVIKYSESFDEGNELFNTAKAMGIEGIVAKKKGQYLYSRKKRKYVVQNKIKQAPGICHWGMDRKR